MIQPRRVMPLCRWKAIAALVSLIPLLLGVTHLRIGDKPPPITLTGVDGSHFSLEAMVGHPVILLFGELYHERSLETARLIQTLVADARFGEMRPLAAMIVAQQAEITALRDAVKQRGLTLPVLHDRDRRVFGAYQVSVLPSVVVIDSQGRVVHAMASLAPQFRDVLTDAALLAAGKLERRLFEETLHPTSLPAESDSALRAARVTELARQLVRGGMSDLAQEKFREALRVEPNHIPALIGLGRMSLQGGRLPEAEEQFKRVLTLEPNSTDAALGLARVQAIRGGKELPQAEQRVRALLARRPADAEAHYLLGFISEQSGRKDDAIASYRKSAELLLDRGGRN